MPPEPVPDDPGRDDDPAWMGQDPMSAEEREAWLDHLAGWDEPPEEEDEEPCEPLTAAELEEVRHATCTGPGCRRPAATCDFEHNTSYEAGGRTCLCNGGPKCRYDHRLKQDPRWTVNQLPDGTFRWITPSGRSYTTEPTRYPI